MRLYKGIIEIFEPGGSTQSSKPQTTSTLRNCKIKCNKKKNLQLFPPHYHRNNPAEKTIGTFKEHLIAGVCSADPDFPLQLWDRLISQCTTTLNLLRPSNINPLLAAEAQRNDTFDYNRT